VKSANWSPSAQLLAVGDYEQNVIKLNNYKNLLLLFIINYLYYLLFIIYYIYTNH